MGRRVTYAPRCPRHRRYKGYRKPQGECEICWDKYAWHQKYGVVEKRKPYPRKRFDPRYRSKKCTCTDLQALRHEPACPVFSQNERIILTARNRLTGE